MKLIYTDIIKIVYYKSAFIQADIIMHIFENLSFTLIDDTPWKAINFDIGGHMDVELTNSSELKKVNLTYQYIGYPIESIDPLKMIKCFTYFSQIKEEWRKIAIDLDYIRFEVNMQTKWFPPSLDNNFYLVFHSAKSMPELEFMNLIKVNPLSFNLITFNKLFSIKYEDCIEYGQYGQNVQDEFPSIRSDCLTLCMLTIMNKTFGSVFARWSINPLTKSVIKHLDDIRFNRDRQREYFENFNRNKFYRYCERQCEQDCDEYYYSYDVKSMGNKLYKIKQGFYHAFDIAIQHNRLPDVLVRHMPEMTFIAFVSNFGGLLGMWLGMSALIIFDNILSFTKRIIKTIGSDNSGKVIIIHNNLATMNVNNTNVNINRQRE